jgi:hypothetical protein
MPAHSVVAGWKHTPKTDDHNVLVGRIADWSRGWHCDPGRICNLNARSGGEDALVEIEPEIAYVPGHGQPDAGLCMIEERTSHLGKCV